MAIDYSIEKGIAFITINRPEKLNCLSLKMYENLGEAFIRANEDENVGVIIISGAGDKSFCVGADLSESIPYLASGHFIDEWDDAHLKHSRVYKPIISAINGYCMGGGFEIMVQTDIRIASDDSIFSLPEVGIGVVPAGGTLTRLIRQIDSIRAMELILTGDVISAQKAYDYGLLNKITTKEKVMDEAIDFGNRILKNSSNAVQVSKEALIKLSCLPWDSAFKLESQLGNKAFASSDAKEGIKSFHEKRKPEFPSNKW